MQLSTLRFFKISVLHTDTHTHTHTHRLDMKQACSFTQEPQLIRPAADRVLVPPSLLLIIRLSLTKLWGRG